MKSHKFSVDDAIKHGVQKALILEHLKFHQENNEGIETYEINGKVWCHAKRENLKKMYPYFSGRSISRWLQELENEGVIESKKPKIKRSDHTKFYRVKGYREQSKSNGQNGHSVKTSETPIDNTQTLFKGNEPNGQNSQSNGQNDHSMNGQNGHSSIYNYSVETKGSKAREKVIEDLNKSSFGEGVKRLYEIDGFADVYVNFWVYLKENKKVTWHPQVVDAHYVKLCRLMDEEGDHPIEVIYQTIEAGNKSLYKLKGDDKKTPKKDDWDQQHLKNSAYTEL